MGLFVNILWGFLAVLVFLLAVLLFMPICYAVRGGYRETFFLHALISIKPLAELAGDFGKASAFTLTVLGIPFKFHPEKSVGSRKKDPAKKRKKEKKTSGTDFKAFLDENFLKSALTFFLDILKIIGPESLEIQGKVGFEDPCYNGFLAALNWFFRTTVPMRKIRIDLEPVWDEEYVDVAISASGRIIIFFILYRVIKFLLARETRTIWKAIRAGRKRVRYAN